MSLTFMTTMMTSELPMGERVICERTVFILGESGKRSPVLISVKLPSEATRLEQKLGQVACIVETDIGFGASRREVLGHDLMDSLSQALIGVEVFILSLARSARIEVERDEMFNQNTHSVFFGDVYKQYVEELKL